MEAQNTEQAAPQHITELERMVIREQVTEQIRTVYDPEIPVNIYELGMIYEINVKENAFVDIIMTLTSPACPAAQIIPMEIRQKTETVKGVSGVNVQIVWEPRWDPSMMSEEARLTLGM